MQRIHKLAKLVKSMYPDTIVTKHVHDDDLSALLKEGSVDFKQYLVEVSSMQQ